MLWSNHVLGHAASGREDLARALAVAVNSHELPCHAPWQPIPWLSWSLRLSAEFGAPAIPEALAIAIQLLHGRHSGSTPKPSRLGLAIECLDSLSLERRDVADVMLAAQLLPALPAIVPGADELEPDGTPAEHAILWGLAALAAGLDPQPWILFAAKLAEPVGLYQGLLDLADDTIRLPGDPPPRLAALLRILAGHETELGGLLEACAGALDDPRRIIECRRALANPQSFSCLTTQREHLLANARAALPSTVTAPGEAFLSSLSEAFVHVEHNLWLRLVMIKAQSHVIMPTAEPQVSVDAAVDYLENTRPWCSGWDVHRFHPMGAPGVLVNRHFIEGMILLALQQVDGSRRADIESLFQRMPAGDLRYFPDWRGLPPDSDSLALVLRLAMQLPSPPHTRLDAYLALLDHNVGEDKLLPVWLPRCADGPTATLPGPFLGDECTATRIVVLLGLLRYDAERFASLVRPNLEVVLASHGDSGFAGCVHYDTDFAVHSFLCLAAEFASGAASAQRQVAFELGVERLAATLCSKLIAQQRVDGGWGSPQRTAFALEGLAVSHASPEVLRRGVKYLVETQRPDGAWPAEGLYITPRKQGGMTPFTSKELTTAICVRALHLAANRLSCGGTEQVCQPL
jgi:hypothetical protein